MLSAEISKVHEVAGEINGSITKIIRWLVTLAELENLVRLGSFYLL